MSSTDVGYVITYLITLCTYVEEVRPVDSLYIISWTGVLTEYIITPHAKSGQDKVTDESPLEATETPRAQWFLARYVIEALPERSGF